MNTKKVLTAVLAVSMALSNSMLVFAEDEPTVVPASEDDNALVVDDAVVTPVADGDPIDEAGVVSLVDDMGDAGDTEEPTTPSAALTVTASKTAPTTKPVTLTAVISTTSSDLRIKDPTGGMSTAGAASRTWTANANGIYTFTVVDKDNNEVTHVTYEVNNIDTRTPSVVGVAYSDATANSMTATVELSEFDTDLYRIDTASLPSGYSASFANGKLTINMPNIAAKFNFKVLNLETNSTSTLSVTTVKQSFQSGKIEYKDYTLLDWDEDELVLRLNFEGMEGYVYNTKSLASKYKAKVTGPNSIEVVCENKAQTLKLEFEDSNGRTKKVAAKIYKAPVVTQIEATDLTNSRTYFKFYFDGLSSSFYEMDEDQFDSDYKAKWKNNILTLRLDVEDDNIPMVFTDDYGNTYELDLELDIDEMKRQREISVSSVELISKNDAAKEAVVEVSFNGVRDLELDDGDLYDYDIKKISTSVYQLTIPYGHKIVTFTFEDPDWDRSYDVKYEFYLNNESPVQNPNAGNSQNSSSSSTSSTPTQTPTTDPNAPNASGNPQTGGMVNSLAMLIKGLRK